jgi:serine phosphatase RsbU (regulator of sigma subunit)/sugar lactone lactonase YvrE
MDGAITVFSGNHLDVLLPREDRRSSIVGFAEQGDKILVMTQQSGLIVINQQLQMSYLSAPFEDLFVSRFHLTNEGNLLVGGFDGLSLFIPSGDEDRYKNAGRIDGLPYTRIQCIVDASSPSVYWVGTEDEGIYRISGSSDNASEYEVRQMGVDQGLQYSSVNTILDDGTGQIWISDYGKGVYRFTITGGHLASKLVFDEQGGLPEAYIKEIIKDDEGNIWFGSQNNGIAVLRDQAFTFYDFERGLEVPEMTALSLKEDNYWFGSDGLLIWVDGLGDRIRRVFTPADGVPDDRITSIFQDEEHNAYFGTAASGVFFINKRSGRITPWFRADNSLGNSINALAGDSQYLWIATNDGVYRIDRNNRSTDHFTTSRGLPHNVVNDILIDSRGREWIATRSSGIHCITEDLYYQIEGNPKLEFMSLAEDDAGEIWAATRENGVIKFMQDSLKIYNPDNGLKAKYTYAVGIDRKGHVWVGHRLGLSRIDPVTENIAVYGPEMGFTSDILHNAIEGTEEGLMLFGTTDGLISYNTMKAREDTVPPRLNIVELTISDSIYDASQDIRLRYGIYKLRIDYIGINMTNPEQVTYRYKLDGFDDWSEPTHETSVIYSRLEDGNYTFMLTACDGNGNCTEKPLMVNITVKIPFWKAWWFILTVIVVSVGTVFTIIKIRERNQKALQEYLEQQLEERTREVIHQKEEIEIKNRDITDSINYAQRIQASILPPIKKLHSAFSGSFVFYQPRDIVSGDFYWYDRIAEDRFLIVCADSTGHGVPGAFMSMIGTTLIKDICLRPDIVSPSDVLKTLDDEVREALNQNVETDGSNDGMDIIVAEINLNTLTFTVSSAMRPVILYKGGEQVYVKGNRSSVGGQLDEGNYEKEFTNQSFQLKKGDIIYMFSDGYPDQFGGPLGRKFKMVRLKNLLRDIHDKPMEEQYNYVKSNFFLWKEDLEQVDDVLFMGVKI